MTALMKRIKNNIIVSVYKIIIAFCALIHLSYFIIFTIVNIKPLAIFNCFSVILYLILLLYFLKKKYVSVIMAAYFEICLHSIFATIFIGWDFGFSLQIITLIPIAFYWPFKKKYTSFIYSFLAALFFILLKTYTFYFIPYYDNIHINNMKNFLYLYNCFISIIPSIVFSSIHSAITKNSQMLLSERNKNLLQLASVDPLTGLLNRRSMVSKLEAAYMRRQKSGQVFSLALCDIDDFKRINDRLGHDCGDYVLKNLSKLIKNTLKEDCSVCRWGGEEILILYHNLSFEYAAKASEDLRCAIQSAVFTYGDVYLDITMTFGVSCGDETCTVSDMLIQADRNLYKGKNNGKNCVVAE